MESKQNNNKGILIVLIALLVGSVGFNVFQYTSHSSAITEMQGKIDTIYIERTKIQETLDLTSADLTKYRGISDSLDKVVGEKQAELEEMETKIKNLQAVVKKDASKKKELDNLIAEYKKKLEDALEQIDQLVIENTKLKGENSSLTTQVSDLTQVKTKLEDKVNTASLLKIEYVKVKAFKKKLLGDGEVETSMAKKAQTLSVCFTVLDNKLAPKGEKTVYVRIIAPDNKVIGDKSQGSGTFNRVENTEETMYTMSVPCNYSNEKMNLCADWHDSKKIYTEGTYTVEIYVDKVLASSSKFVLK
jgi:predicted  nucleic acid-binding Zn-ribbon protein